MTTDEHIEQLQRMQKLQEKLLSRWWKHDDVFLKKCLKDFHFCTASNYKNVIEGLINTYEVL
jgi:hypothetical protein